MEKIKANAIIEIVGAPKEYVKETVDKAIELIKGNKEFKLIKSDISEPEEQEFPGENNKNIKIYSSFAEVEIDFDDFYTLMGFCFEFMPSSIDILEPFDLKITNKTMNESMNDLLARLHQQARIMIEYTALRKKLERMKTPNEQENSSSKDS